MSKNSMLLDGFMPEFDTTRIEQRVVDGHPATVYEAAIQADLVDAIGLAWVVPAVRLAELRSDGDWIRLAECAPNEFAFGAVGRLRDGEMVWEQIESADFTSFDKPGYAKVAANISLSAYGDQQSLLTYETRTQATDEAARRAIRR